MSLIIDWHFEEYLDTRSLSTHYVRLDRRCITCGNRNCHSSMVYTLVIAGSETMFNPIRCNLCLSTDTSAWRLPNLTMVTFIEELE